MTAVTLTEQPLASVKLASGEKWPRHYADAILATPRSEWAAGLAQVPGGWIRDWVRYYLTDYCAKRGYPTP